MVRRQVKGKGETVWHILELGGGGEGGTVLREEKIVTAANRPLLTVVFSVSRCSIHFQLGDLNSHRFYLEGKERKEEEDHHDFPFHLDQFLVAT